MQSWMDIIVLVSWFSKKLDAQFKLQVLSLSDKTLNRSQSPRNSFGSRMFTPSLWKYSHQSFRASRSHTLLPSLKIKITLIKGCLDICVKVLFCTIRNLVFPHQMKTGLYPSCHRNLETIYHNHMHSGLTCIITLKLKTVFQIH